ncbi:hypothetical protein GIW70_00615 [Pseudomonas syringae]|nr:hypothetical protein [Pseudomonas syringae]MCF5066699.1 hypothetical protein [Pseudomonas syringae]
MKISQISLSPPSVDQAPDGVLDPATIPAMGATVRIKPYDDMAYRDHVYVYVGEHYADDLPISLTAVGKDIEFIVAAKEFVGVDDVVAIRYEVQFFEGSREPSETLELLLKEPFESDATLDLSEHNYVASVEKPPQAPPVEARMIREAKWGTGPYVYLSSDLAIATVNERSGEVTAIKNGSCTITATDSLNQMFSYKLTVTGIHEVHFLSPGADWEGMTRLCAAAQLQPLTIIQIKRMWTLYFPSSGPVADYLEWLNYPVWTGDTLGAGTAWTYDLNGSSVNDNASSQNTDTVWQILGTSQA